MRLLKASARRVGLTRSRIAAARMWSERTMLAAFRRPVAELPARILCYHSVGTPQWGVNDVSPARFTRHLEQALKAGCRFVAAEELAGRDGAPGELSVTFDDGLASVARNAAPMLADLGIPWSIFVVSDWAEGRHDFGSDVMLGWRDIEHLAAAGAAIGSHSVSHPNFATLSAAETEFQLGESRRIIEARTGILPTTFAIPFGQSNNWSETATSIAHAIGYTSVFAQAETTRPPGTVARTFVTRFDTDHIFRGVLGGAFDSWEEWL